jgi:hypothetical protein
MCGALLWQFADRNQANHHHKIDVRLIFKTFGLHDVMYAAQRHGEVGGFV